MPVNYLSIVLVAKCMTTINNIYIKRNTSGTQAMSRNPSEYLTCACLVVRGENVTSGTRTTERSKNVLTKMRADLWNRSALVDI